MSDIIYITPSNHDHNPELRTWYYDDFGNRIDKKTGKFVIFVDNVTTDPQILNEEIYYDTKPCDTE